MSAIPVTADTVPVGVPVDNQFDLLQQSPISQQEEGKTSGRSLKDDVKQQAWEARNAVKGQAAKLQEKIIPTATGLVEQARTQLNNGIELAKGKIADLTGDASIKEKSVEQLADQAQEVAEQEWETVKHRGRKQAKAAAEAVDAKLDEKLTPAQKAKLTKGVKQAKVAGEQGLRQASGWVDSALASVPQLRGVRSFIRRNNLQVPALIFTALIGLWLSLTLIRLVTLASRPEPVPEFDIHDREATMNWVKYHAGDFKDKATDLQASLPARLASFLANHKLDKVREDALAKADLWREIGMKRLGLAEPTWSEKIWAYATGRPLTWQGRVEHVLDLASNGIKTAALKKNLNAGYNSAKDSVKSTLGLHEPTLGERIVDGVHSLKQNIPGLRDPTPVEQVQARANGVLDSIVDGVNTIRSKLPGGESIEAARQAAYDATHQSTLSKLQSGAEYVKNRVIHGAQEAAHIAQDKANRIADEAKYKAGL